MRRHYIYKNECKLFNLHPVIWYPFRMACLLRWLIVYIFAYFHVNQDSLILKKIKAVRGIGWNVELDIGDIS